MAENYISEKVLIPRQGGAVPIYRGAPNIDEFINPKTMLNYDDYGSSDGLIARIIELDQDDDQYNAMLRAPFFQDDHLLEHMDQAMCAFCDNVYQQVLQVRKQQSLVHRFYRLNKTLLYYAEKKINAYLRFNR